MGGRLWHCVAIRYRAPSRRSQFGSRLWLFASHLAPEEQPAAARQFAWALTADEEEGASPELLQCWPYCRSRKRCRTCVSCGAITFAMRSCRCCSRVSPVDRSRLVESLSSAQFERPGWPQGLAAVGPPARRRAAEELGPSSRRCVRPRIRRRRRSESLRRCYSCFQTGADCGAGRRSALVDAATLAVAQWYAATFHGNAWATARFAGFVPVASTRRARLAGDQGRAPGMRSEVASSCHDGAGRLGPDLTGVGGRFSPADRGRPSSTP